MGTPRIPLKPVWPLTGVRRRAATALRSRVAGEDAAQRTRRIWGTPGQRWFSADDPIWWVHSDASMFAGGIRALLLQSLHPLALAGVEQHSDYRNNPWARVANTGTYIAATTFGTVEHAEQMIGAVRRIHATARGVTADGRTYSADDPHLLRWVHVAEIESFLTTFQWYGARRLTQEQADLYVAQTGVAAARVGVEDPPTTERQLRAELDAFRTELEGTPAARSVARYLLLHPPLPWTSRPAYGLVAAGAVATLPGWARGMLGVPHATVVDALLGRPVGTASTAALRWVLKDPSVAH